MESSYDLLKFFPLVYHDQWLNDYVSYHARHLDLSLEHGIESGVFFHTHILYMTFVYIQILRISEIKNQEFSYTWIWFANEESHYQKKIWSPFAFSKIKEKTIFRFFRLLNFDESFIGQIRKCVEERNEFAHASWEYIEDLDKKLEWYLSYMQKIADKSQDFLISIYEKFIKDNQSLLEEWYEIQNYDIEQSLLWPYYLSQYELEKLVGATDEKIWNKIKIYIE